jgi:hypothetical protein
LKQRNTKFAANGPWNFRADLGGLRQAAFRVDSNGWLVECEPADALLVIKRIRDAARGDFVTIEIPTAAPDGEHGTSQRVETPHSFIQPSDQNAFIRAAGMVIRIEVPDDAVFEDEESNDDF